MDAARIDRVRELLARADEHARYTSWQSAIEVYREVLAIFPDYHAAQFGIGACYEGLKDFPKAIEVYRVVASADGATVELTRAASARVETLLVPRLTPGQDESYDLALALMKQAARLNEEAIDDVTKLGTSRKTLLAAIRRLESLQLEVNGYFPLHMELGLAYELAGQDVRSIQEFDEYLHAYAALGIPLRQREKEIRIHKATLEFAQTLKTTEGKSPTNAPAQTAESGPKLTVTQATRCYDQALNSETCGAYDQAIELYGALIRDYPGNHQARYHLGLCLQAKGRNDEAKEQWRIAARGKNVTQSFVEVLCELVEKISTPELSTEEERKFVGACADLEAANSLLAKNSFLVHSPVFVNIEDYEKRNEMIYVKGWICRDKIVQLAEQAKIKFRQLMIANNQNFQVKLQLGKSCLVLAQFYPTSNLPDEIENKSYLENSDIYRSTFHEYLTWYEKLSIPSSQKSQSIMALSRELESRLVNKQLKK